MGMPISLQPCKAIFTADDHISAGKEATVASRIPESYTVPFMFCVNLRFISTENTRKLRRMRKQSVPGYIIMM